VILRLLSYNIRYGGTGRETALADTIKAADPHLVVLQEATSPDVVARLAASTGMTQWAATRGHSVGFMSRIEVSHHAWHRPPECSRAFLELVLPEPDLRIFGVHLRAMHSNWSERRRVRELKSMLASIERHQHGFHVLAGDFNTLAPGEKLDLRRLPRPLQLVALLSGGTLRWQTIQIMLDAHYVDGFRFLHPGVKGYTFPTWDPHVRIDFVFVPDGAKDRLRSCEVMNGTAAGGASDHFPLLATLDA
jgi:endonuclease/exonuclease/phosphatase family metal-dependent hydrolase